MSQVLGTVTIAQAGVAQALNLKLAGDPAVQVAINGNFVGATLVVEVSDDKGLNWYSPAIYDLVQQQMFTQSALAPLAIAPGLASGALGALNSLFLVWPTSILSNARVWFSALTGSANVRVESFGGPLPLMASVVVGGLASTSTQILLELQRIRIGIGLLTDNDLAQIIPSGGNPLTATNY